MKHCKGQIFFVDGKQSYAQVITIHNTSKNIWVTFYSFYDINFYNVCTIQVFDLSQNTPLR